MKAVALCTLLLAASAVTHGCLDTSPIDYQPSIVDGGPPVSVEAGLVEACRECVTVRTCSAEYADCKADEKCALLGECLLDTYCFNFDITNLANLKPCLLECALQANILSAEDPSVTTIAPLIRCAQYPTRCGLVCDVR
jgi:hypothetical protein